MWLNLDIIRNIFIRGSFSLNLQETLLVVLNVWKEILVHWINFSFFFVTIYNWKSNFINKITEYRCRIYNNIFPVKEKIRKVDIKILSLNTFLVILNWINFPLRGNERVITKFSILKKFNFFLLWISIFQMLNIKVNEKYFNCLYFC